MRLTKTISTIHFAIMTLLVFITLVFLSLFIVLQYGIHIKAIAFANIKIDALYIKCENALVFEADTITITKSNTKDDSTFDKSIFSSAYDTLKRYQEYVTRVEIETIRYENTVASLQFENNRALISVDSKAYELEAQLSATCGLLYLDRYTLRFHNHPVTFSGSALYERERDTLYAHLHLNVSDRNNFDTYTRLSGSYLEFKTYPDSTITTLPEIIALFDLHEETLPWILEYAQGDTPVLDELSGAFHLDTPDSIVSSLRAKAHWDNLNYTFARGFAPVRAKRGDLEFKEGKLHIYPVESTFYNLYGGDTDLYIDLTKREPVLVLHIDTEGTLDQQMLDLISHYHIDLPIKQHSGRTDIDLTLTINLETEATTALGSFVLHDANISIYNEPIHAQSGEVLLHESTITLHDINASYYNRIYGTINGTIDAAHDRGTITAAFYRARLMERPAITLEQPLLNATYTFDANASDIFSIDPSTWKIDGHTLNVAAITSPFNYKTLQGDLPPTKVIFDGNSSAELTGHLDFQSQRYHFDARLDTLHFGALKLRKTPLHVSISYDENLSFHSDANSSWELATMPLQLSPLHVTLNNAKLHTHQSSAALNHNISAEFSGVYDFDCHEGDFILSNTDVTHETLGKLISHQRELPLHVSHTKQADYFSLPILDFSLLLYPSGWQIDIPDLSQMVSSSRILRDYNITGGSLSFGESSDHEALYFGGDALAAYPILVEDDTPLDRYAFYGNYLNGVTDIILNKRTRIRISDQIEINATHVGFNIPALIEFFSSRPKRTSKNPAPLVRVRAAQSYLHFTPQRNALADTINLEYDNGALFASLQHNDGIAWMDMNDDAFYLYGKKFDDTFMNALFSLSEHQGGEFSIAAEGSVKNFKGIAKVENSRIKDYVLFNNLLAFINTIPSLASFSFPGYAKEGIKVSESYAAFEYYDDVMHISDINFDSEEFDLYGKGNASFVNNSINLTLNLKTDLGSNIASLPVVGYILTGDDGTAATSFVINGKLDNPTVSNTVATDIAVAPFKMILRAFTYPIHLIETLVEDQNVTSRP